MFYSIDFPGISDDVIHYYPRCWWKLSFPCKVRRRGGGGCPRLCGMNTSRGRFPSGHEIVKAAREGACRETRCSLALFKTRNSPKRQGAVCVFDNGIRLQNGIWSWDCMDFSLRNILPLEAN